MPEVVGGLLQPGWPSLPNMGELYVNAFATGVAMNLKQRALQEQMQKLELQNEWAHERMASLDAWHQAERERWQKHDEERDFLFQRKAEVFRDAQAANAEIAARIREKGGESKLTLAQKKEIYDNAYNNHPLAQEDTGFRQMFKWHYDNWNRDVRAEDKKTKDNWSNYEKEALGKLGTTMLGKGEKAPMIIFNPAYRQFWIDQYSGHDKDGKLVFGGKEMLDPKSANYAPDAKPTGQIATPFHPSIIDPSTGQEIQTGAVKWATLPQDDYQELSDKYTKLQGERAQVPDQYRSDGLDVMPQPLHDDPDQTVQTVDTGNAAARQAAINELTRQGKRVTEGNITIAMQRMMKQVRAATSPGPPADSTARPYVPPPMPPPPAVAGPPSGPMPNPTPQSMPPAAPAVAGPTATPASTPFAMPTPVPGE